MHTISCLQRLVVAVLFGLLLGSGSAQAQQTVRIGAPLELTGKFVTYGSQAKRSLEMVVDAFGGTVAGKRIEIVFRDTQSTSQGATSAMTDLIEKEKINFIIGPVSSPNVSVAVPVWRQSKPVWVVPGATSLSFEQAIAGEQMVFHTVAWGDQYHVGVSKMLAAVLGKGKKVAMIYTDGGYGRSNLADARKHYADAGFEIGATEMVRENATDMNPALQKIKLTKPDVLLALMQTTDGIVVAKQIQVAKMGIPYLVGTAAPQWASFAEAVGEEAANGWIGAAPWLPGQALPADSNYPKIFPATKDWEAALRKKLNTEPEAVDALFFASGGMLLTAIERAGGTDDKERVAKELRNLEVQTVMGRSKFGPSAGGAVNQTFNELVVFQRQGGKMVILAPKDRVQGQLKPLQ